MVKMKEISHANNFGETTFILVVLYDYVWLNNASQIIFNV